MQGGRDVTNLDHLRLVLTMQLTYSHVKPVCLVAVAALSAHHNEALAQGCTARRVAAGGSRSTFSSMMSALQRASPSKCLTKYSARSQNQ